MQDNASMMKITGSLNITFLLGILPEWAISNVVFGHLTIGGQKKSPQSFDEAINFLVGGVDGYHRSRRIYQIAVVLLVSPPLLFKD